MVYLNKFINWFILNVTTVTAFVFTKIGISGTFLFRNYMVKILVAAFDTAVESKYEFASVDVVLLPTGGGNLFFEIYAFGSQLVFHSHITAQYV